MIDHLVKPNSIIGTPDGKMLQVADIEARKTYRYDIAPDGSLSGTLFITASTGLYAIAMRVMGANVSK